VKRWWPLVALATTQFLMVLDLSVMNVSLSQLVKDFDTTATGRPSFGPAAARRTSGPVSDARTPVTPGPAKGERAAREVRGRR